MSPLYEIVTASGCNIDEAQFHLSKAVSARLAAGWELQGGVSVAYNEDNDHHGRVTVFLAQAMTYGMTQKENLDPGYVG